MARILVIDDMSATRTTVRRMLQRAGHEVVEAANGREGLKILRDNHVDLVVTDILMPEMEGLETIQEMVRMKSDLPIIAITASSDTPFLKAALKFGAFAGLYKPFQQAELLQAVDEALKSRS